MYPSRSAYLMMVAAEYWYDHCCRSEYKVGRDHGFQLGQNFELVPKTLATRNPAIWKAVSSTSEILEFVKKKVADRFQKRLCELWKVMDVAKDVRHFEGSAGL